MSCMSIISTICPVSFTADCTTKFIVLTLENLPKTLCYVPVDNSTSFNLYYIVNHQTCTSPTIKYNITIRNDLSYTLNVYGKEKHQSTLEGKDGLIRLTQQILEQKVCIGNDDTFFIELAKNREGKFNDRAGIDITQYFFNHANN